MVKPECINKVLENLNNGMKNYKAEFLIGLIDVNEDSYYELLNFTGALIKKETYVLRNEKSAIISISLVLFAIREFQNGQFWNEFATRLDLDEAEAMKIGKKSFEEFCEKNGLYFHVGNKNKGYVTSILLMLFSPMQVWQSFLSFCMIYTLEIWKKIILMQRLKNSFSICIDYFQNILKMMI